MGKTGGREGERGKDGGEREGGREGGGREGRGGEEGKEGRRKRSLNPSISTKQYSELQ